MDVTSEGLKALDWVFLIAYLALSTGLGLFLSGKNKNFKDFMFGGGQVPWFAVGVSLIATSVSATTFLGNPDYAYNNDLRLMTLQIGAFVSFFVVAFIFIPRLRSSGIQSAYELLEIKFSRSVRVLAAILYSLHVLLRVGILIYGPSLVLSQMLGISVSVAILITAVFSIFYTYMGGIRAVIWTDLIQFIVLFGGGLYVLYYLSDLVGGFNQILEISKESNKTNWIDFNFDVSDSRTFISAGCAYIVLEIALRGCDQQFVQRYLSCESTKKANLSSFSSIILGTIISLIFYFIGLGLYANDKVQAITYPISENLNAIFPSFILHVLPTGFKGILIAAIYAAAMSSLDSAISALSNTTVVDFLNSKNKEETQSLKQAKYWVLIWGALGTIAAFICASGHKSLLQSALFFTSLFTGPLLALFICAFFFPWLKSKALVCGVISGMLILMASSHNIPFSMPIENLDLGIVKIIDHKWTPEIKFSWPWNPLIAFCGTMLSAFIFNFFIREKTEEKISPH